MKHRLALILPLYLLAFTASYFAAWSLRFDFAWPDRGWPAFTCSLPFLLLIKAYACIASGEWRRTYRFTTFHDLVWVAPVATVSTTVLYVLNFLPLDELQIPRGVILIDWLFTLLAMSGLRVAWRGIRESLHALLTPQQGARTLIYGCETTGVATLQALRTRHSTYHPVAFVNDGERESRSLIGGVPVLSRSLGWKHLAEELNAQHVLIPGSAPGQVVRDVLRDCREAGLQAHVIPNVDDIVDGRFQLKIRDVTISDLLRREPAQLDQESIRDYVTGRRVLVTGAAGSIGSELCRQLLDLQPAQLVLVDQSEFGMFTIGEELRHRPAHDTDLQYVVADIVDRERLFAVVDEYAPELMFHAAAYKHVPLMEHNPREAVRNNVMGSRNVIDAADKHGVGRLVMISTDKAVRPTSVMGATKLVAEKYLQSVAQRSQTTMITVRFGNVLNSAGSVVPTFRQQIEAGGPVTVTHPEMVRFFMTIPEAVQLVLQAGASGDSGNILILEMGDPVKIVDLAKDMIFLSGRKYPEDIDIVFSGMRPGEKLYEELFYDNEEGASKLRDKIYRAATKAPTAREMQWHLARLEATLGKTNSEAREALWSVVASFVAASDNAVQQPARIAA